MKITRVNGIIRVSLDHVEELPAAMTLLSSDGDKPIEIELPGLTGMSVVPVPIMPMIAPMAEMPLPGMPSPAPESLKAVAKRNYPVTTIGTVYATDNAVWVRDLLMEHPEGMTTRQMVMVHFRAELAKITDPAMFKTTVDEMVGNLTNRVGAARRCGLVRAVPHSRLRMVSELGKIAKLEITSRPACFNAHNKKLATYVSGLMRGEYE